MDSYCRNKIYVDNGKYHIYNRGVAKMKFFYSANDYRAYLRYLKDCLLPRDELIKKTIASQGLEVNRMKRVEKISRLKNYSECISLYSFTLMPNHIHLVVEQKNARDMSQFITSLHTRYVRYFNRQNDRVGPLFQGRFNAKFIPTDRDLVKVSRYVHRNPISLTEDLAKYPWSSLKYYKSGKNPKWLNISKVRKAFRSSNYSNDHSSYISFVHDRL